MMRPRHTLLVANPTAQSGKNAERIVVARAMLNDARVPHVFLATLPDGGTMHAVAEALKSSVAGVSSARRVRRA